MRSVHDRIPLMPVRITRPAIWIVALCLVLAASYALVQGLFARDTMLRAVPHAPEEMRRLRAYHGELQELLREFEARPAARSTAEKAGLEGWAETHYAPRVNDVRQRLVLAEASGPAYAALLAAADRLAALAANPGSERARNVARAAIESAGESLTAPSERAFSR